MNAWHLGIASDRHGYESESAELTNDERCEVTMCECGCGCEQMRSEEACEKLPASSCC